MTRVFDFDIKGTVGTDVWDEDDIKRYLKERLESFVGVWHVDVSERK